QESLAKDLKKDLKSKHAKLERAFDKTLSRSRPLLRTFDATETQRIIAKSANSQFAAITDAAAAVDPHEIESIHRLRLAFKKFRYSIQAAQPVLHDTSETTFQHMHDFQDMLGRIHDSDLFFDALAKWGRKRKKSVQRDLAEVYGAVAQQRRDSIEKVATSLNVIQTLWRPYPDEETDLAPKHAVS